MISEFKLKPDRNRACIPIPMEAADFTFNEEWIDFIENDDLKTTMITLKTVSIMGCLLLETSVKNLKTVKTSLY